MSENLAQPEKSAKQAEVQQTAVTGVTAGKDINIGSVEQTVNIYEGTTREKPLEIHWHEVSLQLVEERLQLTTSPMTRREDIAYQVKQVYVPMGLVERKKVPRRKADVPPEHGSELYWEGRDKGQYLQKSKLPRDAEPNEVEVTQRFEHQQFLEQVLQRGQSPKSKGKKIAIIGEPGSGKTTLLQQIARWVSVTFPKSVIIWVSLADLQSDRLESYLEHRWLQRVIREAGGVDVSQAVKLNFAHQFKQGRVWLLLDGLDEMQVNDNPLSEMRRQIQEGGWLQQARILLTCRVNLWDSNRNTLYTFDTYRTLEFVDLGQVEQFIEQWFAPRGNVAIQQGQVLCRALKEPEQERIRDLVKNPLRLTLLCFHWYLKGGHLPKVQAELYQMFVDRIYEWKVEEFPTKPEQRQALNRALAQLSLAAIDDRDEQGNARFRLRHRFMQRFLSAPLPNSQETLFDLALQLGWLNQIGVDADDPTQKVYAFYHTTFEEYFAALAIDDWDFFLPREHRCQPVKDLHNSEKQYNPSYRIFEPQWKQVFLLWLGRQGGELEQDPKLKQQKKAELEQQKEGLIQALTTFKDGCKGFYSDRAFILAAVGIAEFQDCTRSDEIVNQLMQWEFGSSNWLKHSRADLIAPGREEIRAAWAETTLRNTDSHRVTQALVQVLETTQDKFTREKAVESLGKIGTGNETAIQALARVLETPQDVDIYRLIAEGLKEGNPRKILGQIDPGNETVIRALVRALESGCLKDVDTLWRVAESLGQIDPGNEMAVWVIVCLLTIYQWDWDTDSRTTEGFGIINLRPGNEVSIQALAQVLEITQDEDTRGRVARCLGDIGAGNETAIQALARVLQTTQDEDIYYRCPFWEAVESLGKIDPGNETAIQALTQVLQTTQDENTRQEVAESLGKIGTGNETAIQALVQVLKTTQDEDTREKVAESLGTIGTGNETAIQALARVLEIIQNEYTRWKLAESLGKIDPGNETTIRALVELLETTQDKDTIWRITEGLLWRATEGLGTVGIGNETAIQALAQVWENTQDWDTRRRAAKSYNIRNLRPGNETTIRSLVWLLKRFQDKRVDHRRVAESLDQIEIGNETAIGALVRLLETTQDENTRVKAAESLGKIDPGNETAIRALVQMLETTQNENTRVKAAESLGKIDLGNETAIRILVQVLETTQDWDIRRRAAKSLGQIDPGNETAIGTLARLLETIQDKDTRRVAEGLGQIDPGNESAIQALAQVLEIIQHTDRHERVVEGLGQIGTGNETAIQALARVLEIIQNEHTRWRAIKGLGTIGIGNESAIRALAQVLHIIQNEDIWRITEGLLWRAIKGLGTIGIGNESAIRALAQVLETTQDEDWCQECYWRYGWDWCGNRWRAAESLVKIDPGNETAIQALVQVLETTQNKDTRERVAESLGDIGASNETAIRALVKVLETTKDKNTRERAAKSLVKIDPGNKTAIQALARVVETSQNGFDRWEAAKHLGQIDPGNETAVRALVRGLKSSMDEDLSLWACRWIAVENLADIATGNETAIQALVWELETPHDIDLSWDGTPALVAESLDKIDPGNETAIQALAWMLETTQDENTRQEVAESLGKIGTVNVMTIRTLVRSLRYHLRTKEAQNLMMKCVEALPYPEFYQTFHASRPSPEEVVALVTAMKFPRLQKTASKLRSEGFLSGQIAGKGVTKETLTAMIIETLSNHPEAVRQLKIED